MAKKEPICRRNSMNRLFCSFVMLISIGLSTSLLTGCFGLYLAVPDECYNENPSTDVHNHFKTSLSFSSKSEFLKEWGKPDIIEKSGEREVWEYKRKLWCGSIPMFFVPIPLILPLCDGFDRIEFEGDKSVNLHTRRTSGGGAVCIGPIFGPRGSDPSCKNRIRPYNFKEVSSETELSSYDEKTTYRIENKPDGFLVNAYCSKHCGDECTNRLIIIASQYAKKNGRDIEPVRDRLIQFWVNQWSANDRKFTQKDFFCRVSYKFIWKSQN